MAFASREGTDICLIKMLEAIETMEEWGISGKPLDEMKAQFEEKLNQGGERDRWMTEKAFVILSEVRDEDERKRKVLLDFYSKFEGFLDKIDEKDLDLVKVYSGNFKEDMKSHMEQLRQKEFFILVLGETSSGKTTVVNLILGEELLPYSVLSTTSTICELKYGEQRKIVVHFKDEDPETGQPTKTIFLEDPTGSSEQSYLRQITPYVHRKSNDEKTPIKKIEIFWKHSLLQNGIVIVDSPGVGESDEMDKMVIQYLPQAFAFIYVINSTNAGGIQKDRLEKLLHEVQEVPLGLQEQTLQEHLLSQCALFVFNKWDQVDPNERRTFRNDVTEKLQKLSPGIDPESQMIYVSAKNAAQLQNYGYISEYMSSLMDHMKILVEKSIEIRMEIYWRWIYSLLSRITIQAKIYTTNAVRNREEANRELRKVLLRLKGIEKQQHAVVGDLRNFLNDLVKDAVEKLSRYLSCEELQARFTSWAVDQLPKREPSWEMTKHHVGQVLSKRFREFIQKWDEDNEVSSNAHQRLFQVVQERCNCFEEQLHKIQTDFADGSVCPEKDIAASESREVTRKLKVFGMSSFHAFIAFVRFWLLPPKKLNKTHLERWCVLKKNEEDKLKSAQMSKISAEFFAVVASKSKLELLVRGLFEPAESCLKHLQSRIPELIQADRMLYKRLRDDKRTKKEVQDLYQPIVNEGSKFRGQLLEFGMKEILVPDIASDELHWKEDRSSVIGRGTFGTLYQGTLTRNGNVKTVALKVCGHALDAHNACNLMGEVETLRKLDHPNVVTFYGTSLLKERDTMRLILVMERCKGDLRSEILKHHESVSGKSEDPDVVRVVCRWVEEIAGGLDYIHSQGIVHRDLKLENILLSDENAVKIADVGRSKQAADITGTYEGTPLYMAPEVFQSRVYDSKADIYSLGIILWEMWYGQRAPVPAEVQTPALFAMVNGGLRPGDVEGCTPPPVCWKQLMEKCWHGNPEERPTAESCKHEAKIIVSYFENE